LHRKLRLSRVRQSETMHREAGVSAAPGTDEKEALLLAEAELPQNRDSPALPFPV
jgi:hypothetical protein